MRLENTQSMRIGGFLDDFVLHRKREEKNKK